MRLLLSILALIACTAQGQMVLKSGVLVSGAVMEYFSPTNISGFPALAWYIADDVYTNASTMILPDRTGNGFDLTNRAATSTWPAPSNNAANGHKALVFDGTDDLLRNDALTVSNRFQMTIVMKQVAAGTTLRRVFNSTNGQGFWFYTSNAGGQQNCAMPTNNTLLADFPLATNGTFMVHSYFVTNNVGRMTTNTIALPYASGAGTVDTNGFVGMVFGNRLAGDRPGDMQVCEVIVYNSNLPATSSALVSRLQYYLKNKYGL